MPEEISYEYLFDLLRREKTREDLQSIDKNFYNDMFSSLDSREQSIRQKELQKSLVMNAELEKEKIEIKNIRKILNEIKDRRQKKIILLALSRARIPSTIINHEVFTSDEENFFNSCVELFRKFKNNNHLLSEKVEHKPIIEKENPSPEPKLEPKLESEPLPKEDKAEVDQEKDVSLPKNNETNSVQEVKVQFLEDTPNFYGPKKELLGPFKKDDIVVLPEIIAEILINKGRTKLYPNNKPLP